jgi:hypothetical protein
MLILKDKVCKNDTCCQKGKRICPPEEVELPILARKACGLDVVAWIGHQRMVGGRSLPEVHATLRGGFGVNISPRNVAYLFQVFMALVHCVNADEGALRQQLIDQGKISLSIDAVFFDSTSPGLVVLRDTISKRILYSERLLKRDTEQLRLLLKKVKDIGVPIVGVVSDKEQAQVLAVEKELPGVPHQYCQVHFLKNVVKQMDADLGTLNETVNEAVTNVRRLEKELPERAQALDCSDSELKLATALCKAAYVAGKAAGDPILDPPALKRFERIEAVVKAAEDAALAAAPATAQQVTSEARQAVEPEVMSVGGNPGQETATTTAPSHSAARSLDSTVDPTATIGVGDKKPHSKARDGKRTGKQVSPLLVSVLGALVGLQVQLQLARRLRRQVEVVRKVAHILNFRTSGTQVKRMLASYLNRLLRQATTSADSAFGDFIRHLDAVADRYWAGLFHCYDVPELPSNNSELERQFGAFKRIERKATGRKSTAGGPLETCAEFLLESWDTVVSLPNLTELLRGVTDEQLKAALKEMERLSESAKTKRRIQRDLDGFLAEALAEWRNQ